MKKVSLASLLALLFILCNLSIVFAQGGKRNLSSVAPMYESSVAALNAETDRLALEKLKLASPSVFKKFTRMYSDAEHLSVSELKNFTIIHFACKGINTRVMYNAKGSWNSTMEFLKTDQIPKSITGMVNRQFPKARINGGSYIKVPQGKAHLVYLQTADKIITARVVDGELDIYKSFDRQ